MFLLLDTETNGMLPKGATYLDIDKTPRIIQISWKVLDIELQEVSSYTYLIKPDGWEVPSVEMFLIQGQTSEQANKSAKFWIDNGFTQKQNEEEGKSIQEVFEMLIKDMAICNFFVAHNLNFDKPVLSSEMHRYGVKSTRRPLNICTMLSTVELCKKPSPYGRGYKWPTLTELHIHLFGKTFEGAHDAGDDVAAMEVCFIRCLKMNYIYVPYLASETEIRYAKYKDYKDAYLLNQLQKENANQENKTEDENN